MPRERTTGRALAVAVIAVTTGRGGAGVVEVVALEGQPAPGTPDLLITSLGAPFTDGNGVVGFTGAVDDGVGTDRFVWYGAAVAWRNSDGLPLVLSGAESTMGVSDTGGFIYSPSTDGDDSVWTDAGPSRCGRGTR